MAFSDNVAARYKQKKQTEDGNTVYLYSDRQIALRNTEKAKRLKKLTGLMSGLRKRFRKDLDASDPKTFQTALVVALIDETFERVGNPESAEDGHFGVTQWQKGHVAFSNGKASVRYVGKSGVRQTKTVSDAKIVKALKKVWGEAEGKESDLFPETDAEAVNNYLPEGVTAKDIRGLHANRVMRDELSKATTRARMPDGRKERQEALKESFKKALEATAKAVGHEPATLKGQYLVPGLEESFLKDGTIEGPQKLSARVVAKSKKKVELKPGDFTYMGATVFEIDNNGKKQPRDDIGPGYEGDFRHKYYTGEGARPEKTAADRVVSAFLDRQARQYAIDSAFVERLRKDFLTLMGNIKRVRTEVDVLKLREGFKKWKIHLYKVIFQDWLNKKELWKSMQAKDLNTVAWNFYIELPIPEDQQQWPAWEKRVKRRAQVFWKALKDTIQSLKEIREREEQSFGDKPVDESILTPGTMYGESDSEQRMELEGFRVTVRGLDPTSDTPASTQQWKEEEFSRFRDTLRQYKRQAQKYMPMLLKLQVPMVLDYSLGLDKGGDYAHWNRVIRINPSAGEDMNMGSRVRILAHEMGHHVYKYILSGEDIELWKTAITGVRSNLSLAEVLQKWPDNIQFTDDFVKYMAGTDPVFALQVEAAGGWDDRVSLWKREDFQALFDEGQRTVNVPTIPITTYAEKNPEEAFCEAVGQLVGYGPRALHEKVRRVLSLMLPGQIKTALVQND